MHDPDAKKIVQDFSTASTQAAAATTALRSGKTDEAHRDLQAAHTAHAQAAAGEQALAASAKVATVAPADLDYLSAVRTSSSADLDAADHLWEGTTGVTAPSDADPTEHAKPAHKLAAAPAAPAAAPAPAASTSAPAPSAPASPPANSSAADSSSTSDNHGGRGSRSERSSSDGAPSSDGSDTASAPAPTAVASDELAAAPAAEPAPSTADLNAPVTSDGTSQSLLTNVAAVVAAAKRMGVDPSLAVAMMLVESGGNNMAVGDGGTSFGLFQLHRGGELGSLTQQQAENPTTNASVSLAVVAGTAAKMAGASPGAIAAAAQRPADRAGYAVKVNGDLSRANDLISQAEAAAATP